MGLAGTRPGCGSSAVHQMAERFLSHGLAGDHGGFGARWRGRESVITPPTMITERSAARRISGAGPPGAVITKDRPGGAGRPEPATVANLSQKPPSPARPPAVARRPRRRYGMATSRCL